MTVTEIEHDRIQDRPVLKMKIDGVPCSHSEPKAWQMAQGICVVDEDMDWPPLTGVLRQEDGSVVAVSMQNATMDPAVQAVFRRFWEAAGRDDYEPERFSS